MEDVADLDDAAALESTTTQQEDAMPTGGNLAEELKRALVNKKAAQEKHNLAAGHFFTFYMNLLSKNARYPCPLHAVPPPRHHVHLRLSWSWPCSPAGCSLSQMP